MKTTTSKTLNKTFNYKPIHIRLTVDDELWQHDEWKILIDDVSVDYRTGIGHRRAKGSRYVKKEFDRLMNMNPANEKENLKKHNERIASCSVPVKPNIDDVLYSLVIDCTEESFEDWCMDLGYDPDSRKAYSIHQECVKTKGKLEELGIDLEEAREAFQDY